ncbi:MAG: hypothetical protein J3K34DRAFT_471300 [Monoraphidium minutum]|nr:MAG: hypothetical protein J3K34DRAFT_471300 [Monoraphidium minutum]
MGTKIRSTLSRWFLSLEWSVMLNAALRRGAGRFAAPPLHRLQPLPPPPLQQQQEQQRQQQEAAPEGQARQQLEDAFRIRGPSNAAPPAAAPPAAAPPARAAAPPPWLAALHLPAWLVEAEQRLEADLPTIGLTILFMTALIAYERGVQSLLDNVFGDSPKGSVACITMGLFLVFGVKLSGVRFTALWDVSGGARRRR